MITRPTLTPEVQDQELQPTIDKVKKLFATTLHLSTELNKGIIDYYSPAKVVKAREYQEQKEVLKAAEDKAKLERKI
ncbi:hypothetical protein V8E51_004234 [Hyaloscypha variabilis]